MKTLILIPLIVAMSGCASTDSNKYCETPVRDLTQDWQTRTYWCLPKGYEPLFEKQVVTPTNPNPVSIVDIPSDKPEPLVLYTEHESLQHRVREVSRESLVSNQNTKAKSVFTEGEQKKAVIGTEPKLEKTSIVVNVIEPVIELAKNSSDITLFDVNFTKHNLDTDFSKNDLAKIVGTVNKEDVIKLQGCRLESEIDTLVLGRALAVRKALIREGVENKIIILSNPSCGDDKKVKVNV